MSIVLAAKAAARSDGRGEVGRPGQRWRAEGGAAGARSAAGDTPRRRAARPTTPPRPPPRALQSRKSRAVEEPVGVAGRLGLCRFASACVRGPHCPPGRHSQRSAPSRPRKHRNNRHVSRQANPRRDGRSGSRSVLRDPNRRSRGGKSTPTGLRGDDRNRTGVDGFAGRCVATPPRRQSSRP